MQIALIKPFIRDTLEGTWGKQHVCLSPSFVTEELFVSMDKSITKRSPKLVTHLYKIVWLPPNKANSQVEGKDELSGPHHFQ